MDRRSVLYDRQLGRCVGWNDRDRLRPSPAVDVKALAKRHLYRVRRAGEAEQQRLAATASERH